MIINKFYIFLKPPAKWKFPVSIFLGILGGLFIFIFIESKMIYYISNAPETCINCHIMIPQYSTWMKSSHQDITCNDCHIPQDNFFNKYYFKAKDGFRHGVIYTFQMEKQVIRITQSGLTVVQKNCLRCHGQLNENIIHSLNESSSNRERLNLCIRCHRDVPHGRISSLSSITNAIFRQEHLPVSKWIFKKKKIEK
jgi:cytochrome c nitrite reductase small subunit